MNSRHQHHAVGVLITLDHPTVGLPKGSMSPFFFSYGIGNIIYTVLSESCIEEEILSCL